MSDMDDVSDNESGSEKVRDSYQNPPPPDVGPYLEITEEPQSRGFRFRYACEGKSHGGLQSVLSRREKKSYPTVRINRHKGPAKIMVTLVTDGKDPKPHAHELIGKNCQNGICSVTIKGENMTVSFPNLGVRHITKKNVTSILMERIRESLKVDKMMKGMLGQSNDLDNIVLTNEEEEMVRSEAVNQAKLMPLSVVRLKFQAYLLDMNGICTTVLSPVISTPIYDSKAPCASLLKICRMDKVGGCCTGNEEVFLLCDKVQKEDIAVRFYEQDEEGNVKWEDYGNFAPHDVHRQYAIVFRTPSYLELNIDRPVAVHVQLKRFSDGEVSDPKTFTYYPQQTDLEDIQKKRKKQIPNFNDSEFFSSSDTKNMGSMNSNNNRGSGSFFGNFRQYDSNSNGNTRSMWYSEKPSVGLLPLSVINQGIAQLEEDSVLDEMMYNLPGPNLTGRGAEIPGKKWEGSEIPTTVEIRLKEKLEDASPVAKATVVEEKPITLDKDEKETNESIQPSTVANILAKLLTGKVTQMTESLQLYATTEDARHLIMPVRSLIQQQNADGDNSVHLSVIHEKKSAAKNILSALSTLIDQSPINEINCHRQTPLYISLVTKQSDLLKSLLASGANWSILNGQGNTLIHIAAQNGSDICLELLLQKCSQSSDPQSWRPTVNDLNFDGFSALHLAVLNGHLNCVKLLLTSGGADVNLPDQRSGRTALHHAVDINNLAIVGHLILESGADVNQPAYDGNTALHLAASMNRLGIAALLMAADADPNAENMEVEDEESFRDYDDEESDVENANEQAGVNVKPIAVDQERTGVTPKDIAKGNPKMLRILNGESYSSVSDKVSTSSLASITDVDVTRLKSFYDSGIDSIKLRQSLEIGDLQKLDSMVRVRLAKLLDPVKPGSDWLELAKRLGLQSYSNTLRLQKSPTRALLDNYEVLDGTSSELRKCLLEMQRRDAVQIIDETSPSMP